MTSVQNNRASLEEAGITVEIEPSLKEAPSVISDRSGLIFILGQLLSNSVKHARVVRISAETVEPRQPASGDGQNTTASVALIFSDDGPGVSAADLPFIFDKGFTGASVAQPASVVSQHSSAAGANTGMGLYLAQRMANDLVIEMTAASEQAGFERTTFEQATSEQSGGLAVILRFSATRKQA
jgi:signal transduction histidine kinase